MKFFESQRFDVRSALTPEECCERLRKAIDEPTDYHEPGITGTATESQLRLRKDVPRGGSFQTYVCASMRVEDGGTRIEGTLELHPFTRFLGVMWLVFAAFATPAVLWKAGWRDTLISLGALGMQAGIGRFGLYQSRGDAQFLLDYLAQTVGAERLTVASL